MRLHPNRIPLPFLCLILSLFIILAACSKDIDILTDAILSQPEVEVEDGNSNNPSENSDSENSGDESQENEDQQSEQNSSENNTDDGLVSKIASFSPSNDAFVQSGRGYNQQIIRLEEGNRISYIMFDLTAIEDIGGLVTDATLEFTIVSDDGDGIINVFIGDTNNWTETNLSNENAPIADLQIGSIEKVYEVNITQEVVLSGSDLVPGLNTLILDHKNGNDLAFASKEHPDVSGPILTVTYKVPENAPEINMDGSSDSNDPDVSEENNGNENPLAIADATPTSGQVPLEVTFTGENSSDNNEIVSYLWDFQDGNTANTANANHTFTETGTYEVSLTVTDNEGLTNTDMVTISVSEDAPNVAPSAVAEANPTSGQVPLEVTFDGRNSTDDNAVIDYLWNFKDGNTSNESNPTHTFTEAGTYYVTLNVADEQGLSDETTITITVTESIQNEPPNAIVTASPISGDAPLEVQFISSDSNDDNGIVSRYWDFKDGHTATNINPSHTFQNAGVYDVEFTVTDVQGLYDTEVITITVNDNGNNGGGNTGGGNGTYPPDAVYASSFGFNPNDATQNIKNAINSSANFIVIDKQSSDWVVGPLTFTNISNKTIVFEDGVVLRAKSGAFPNTSHRLFQLIDCNNIEIRGYGASFIMNKSEYTDGQQRHTLSILRSTNITARGLTLRDSGGDGVYIGRYNPGEYCQNITIEDITALNHARQGMSVISVDGLTVRNCTFSGTIGEAPGAGIDFEPDFVEDRFDNILVENCIIENNWGPGILFALTKTNSGTVPLDVTFRNIYLSNNFSPSNPAPYPTEIDLGMSTGNPHNPIRGSITFDGLTIENSKWAGIYSKKTLEAYSVTIKNALIKNVSTSSNLPAIHIGLLDYGNTSTANMGGFTFENVLIDYDGVDHSLELHGPSDSTFYFKNMYGQIRVRSPQGIRLKDDLNLLSSSDPSVTLTIIPY